jgi:UDP-GlcNAc3NAcA epimerase
VGADKERIVAAARQHFGRHVEDRHEMYGGGRAAERIVAHLAGY